MISDKLRESVDQEGRKIGAIMSTYKYPCHLAETNKLVAYKVRYEFKNPSDKTGEKNSKAFRFFDLDGNPKLPDGLNAAQFHLYGWNSIGDAKNVMVVEGEECVKALIDKGFASVSPMTTGKPCEEAFKVLKDKPCVGVWADADPPKRNKQTSAEARFDKVVEGLHQVGQQNLVRIDWEDAPPKGDAVDAINQGVDINQLLNDAVPIKAMPPKNINGSRPEGSKLQITRLSEVKSTSVAWLWKNRIPLGKNTIFSGDPNVGKSWLTLDIASHVSTGSRWPDGAECEVGNVLLITAEDGLEDTVAHRLNTLGADTNRISHVSMEVDTGTGKESLQLDKHLSEIEEVLGSENTRLLIIDPITAVVGGRDSHKATDVRQLMTPVTEMAERTQTAIITVMHQNKTSKEFNPLYRVGGSGDFVAVARSVYLVAQHPDDDNLRIFSAVKSNLSSPARPLAFEISLAHGFKWSSKPVSMTARDLLLRSQSMETTSQLEEAIKFLAETLKDGSMPSKEVKNDAYENGISERTLERAKNSLRVESKK